MLPFGPGRGIRDVRAQGLTDAQPLQVGRHQQFQRAVRHCGLDGASPATLTFAGALWADAPLLHAQGLGVEDDLVLIHELLGVG